MGETLAYVFEHHGDDRGTERHGGEGHAGPRGALDAQLAQEKRQLHGQHVEGDLDDETHRVDCPNQGDDPGAQRLARRGR